LAVAVGCNRQQELNMKILLLWLLNALALFAVAGLIEGVHIEGFGAAMLAVVILGLVNALIRPLLVLLTLPVTVLTLGLFIFVINGLLFWFVGSVLKSFVVTDFWSGLLGAILYSIFSWALASLLRGQPFKQS
jgi:putative membrane protein